MSPLSQAGIITWNGVADSADASDVAVFGTAVEAIDAANTNIGNLTVNGVTFANSNNLLSETGFSGALEGTSTGDTGYDQLLNTFDYGNGTDLVTLSIGAGNLLVGNDYLIQVWYTDVRDCCSMRDMVFGDGSLNTVTINSTGAGGFGQFAVGSFSADANSQSLTLDAQGFRNAHITGYQIRDVTNVNSVPEPSMLMLLSLGLIGLGFAGRKTRS